MLISIRDVTEPPNEASSFVESYQVQAYINISLVSILVYDSRTPSVGKLHFILLLTLYQSVYLTKRYVNERLLCNLIVTLRDRQVKYFWVRGSVSINIDIYIYIEPFFRIAGS